MKRLIIATAAIVGTLIVTASAAFAGISPAGYAQVAQRALYRSGHPYGYNVRCHVASYDNYTARVRIVCTMTEG